jgi:hypothetical protein
MRLLVAVGGLVLVVVGSIAAKELKVTNSVDFANCAAGVALTAGPDAGQTALAGDTCVVMPGAYGPVVVMATLVNLKILANVGATLNGQIVIQANGVQIGASGRGFTINDNVGPAAIQINVGMGATQNITIEGNVVMSTMGPAIQSIGTADLRNLRILGNQVRSTVANGISFGHTGALEDAVIADNTLETNGGAGIGFLNGRVRKLSISNNRLNSNAADGVVFVNTSSVEELELSRNTIRGNTVGVQFSNAGGVSSVAFSGNTISANQAFNVLFANGGFVEDVSFEGDELSTTTGMGAPGVLIANAGVTERIRFTNALIERNNGHGIFIVNSGRLREFSIVGGRIRNNAGHNVFIEHSFPGTDFGVSNILFQDVVIEQADDNGVRILTNTAEISPLSFKNVLLAKNGALGICVRTTTGTMGDISVESSTVKESQGGPGTTSCDGMAPQAEGSGIEILTLGNTPVSNVQVLQSVFTNNGGFGLRLHALGNDRVSNIAIQGNRFEQNGTRAALGQGSGVSIRGQIVEKITINPTVANDNNDHGVEITASRDILNVSISGGEFSNNDRNRDGVGAGISVSANEDLLDLHITDCKLFGNTKGVRVQADTARDHHVTNCEISNNTQAGVEASIPNGENLDATNNYWGSPSGPSAPNGAVGQVTASPFLSAPPGGPTPPIPPTPPTPPMPPTPPAGGFAACAAGADNRIDDIEMLGILDAWIKGQGYQSCGVPTDLDVLQALDRWARGV